MAKQKSGLGRGLNALFDEANNRNAHGGAAEEDKKTVAKQEESETSQASLQNSSSQNKGNEETSTSNTAPSQEMPQNTSSQTGNMVDMASTAPRTVQKTQNTTQNQNAQESNIYFSEDALENAKVVERDVPKKPTLRTTPEQKRKTAEILVEKTREQENVRVASAPETPTSQKEEALTTATSAHAGQRETQGEVGEVDINLVHPNPDQPRTHFKPEELEELASSIKKEGLLQPVLVTKVGEQYQIIAGERRWQACKSLGMQTIPVRFWVADNDKSLELALIENIQRSDLNPIEEAYGYKRLMERRGMTQSEVAQTVSKGRSTIANALRLLDLPEDAQQLLFEEKITAGHARAILSIPTPEGRKTLTKKLVNENLSVRETESIARLLAGRDAQKGTMPKRPPLPANFKKAARSLSKFLSVPVRVKTAQGKNKIEIQFQDEEELERILEIVDKGSELTHEA